MRKESELSRLLRLGMVLVVSTGLAACAPEEEAELETPETDAPEVENVEAKRVDIESVNSTVEGEANITRTGESLMIALTLDNLPGAGPYEAQLVSGRCDDIEDAAERGATPPPATTPQTPAGAASGRMIATLEPIQVTGTSGMSHSTVAVSNVQSDVEGAIKIMQGGTVVGCGNVDLDDVNVGAAPGTAPYGTPAPGTTPAPAPGTRP